MKLSSAVQEALLALLCYDNVDGATAAALVEEKHYDPVYREIAEQALAYRQRHKRAPGTHTLDIFQAAKERDDDRAELYERLFESIKKTRKGIEPQYVLDRARAFVKLQRMKRALASAVRSIQRDDESGLLECESTLDEALKGRELEFTSGLSFIHDIRRSTAFLESPEESFPTGIAALDERGLGPVRKRLYLFVAPAKAGKSWHLAGLAKSAYQHALRVVYVSFELSEQELSQRFTQALFSMSKRAASKIDYRQFVKTESKKDWGTEWDLVKLRKIENFADPSIKKKLRAKLKTFADGERIILKEFPMSSVTPKRLEAYLDALEHREKYIPDLLVIDYSGIMKLNPKVARWEGVLEVTQEMKRIAQERNIAVATAQQTKASAATASRIDKQHIGSSWDQIATADTVITYSQTDEEREDKIARLFVAAARTDEDRFEILVSQSYEIGQFALSSIRLGENYYKERGGDGGD